MGREIRKVPANWEHPREFNQYRGMVYKPLRDEIYEDVAAEWESGRKLWESGKHPHQLKYPQDTNCTWEEWHGSAPEKDDYMPSWKPEERTHIQLYETTSEGTPESPVFPADQFDQLCEYAAAHCTTFADWKATKEQWKEMLSKGLVYHKQGNIIFS